MKAKRSDDKVPETNVSATSGPSQARDTEEICNPPKAFHPLKDVPGIPVDETRINCYYLRAVNA